MVESDMTSKNTANNTRPHWRRPGLRSVGVAGMLALLLTVVAAVPVQAQTNDDRALATEVTEPLPYTDSVDTTGATGAADDPGCTAGAGNPNNPTVWYSYTPSTDGFVLAHTFGSNYDTELSAYADDGAGGLTQLACNDDAGFGLQSQVVVEAVSGTEILFMAGSCCGSSLAGQLEFTVDVAPEPLMATLTVDSDPVVAPADGVASVSGTIECSRPAEAQVSVTLDQTRGGAAVFGFGDTTVSCDGPSEWVTEVAPLFGSRFSGGRAQVSLSAFVFDFGEFVQIDGGTHDVRLKGSRPTNPGPEPRVDVTADIEYGSADGQSLLLDLYEPASGPRRDRAAVIFAHGGGFTGGDKGSGTAPSYATDLAGAGLVSASINYRLNGVGPGFIDAQHDMQAAVRWFRSNAESLGVDPDRIFVMGYSAGAIMSMYTNFNSEDPGSSGTPGVSSEVAGGISLAGFAAPTLIDPGEPPVLMFHGTADTTVPFGAAEATCETTIAAGNSCDLQVYDGVGHFLESFHDEIVERTLVFVDGGD